MRRALLLFLFALGILHARKWTDVPFGQSAGDTLLLDAEVPDGPGPHPAVIIVHGGGFLRGDKQTYVTPMFPLLSKAGYAWFSVNYQLAPKGTMDGALDDVRAAIRHVKERARDYNVDPSRLALLGESAGGAIVALLATKDRDRHALVGVVDFYGGHDFVQLNAERKRRDASYRANPEVMRYFSGEAGKDETAAQRKASAVQYVGGNVPPMLLIHGTKDEQVFYDQSPLFCEALRKAGNRCELVTVDGGGHGMGGWEKEERFQAYKPLLLRWLGERFRH